MALKDPNLHDTGTGKEKDDASISKLNFSSDFGSGKMLKTTELFEWFFIVQHSDVNANDISHRNKSSSAEITFSCLDDRHSPEFLARMKAVATELTIPYRPTYKQKTINRNQAEFFYFENDDRQETTLHVACLLHWESLTVQGFISRKCVFGELQEVLMEMSRLRISVPAPGARRDVLTELVTELYDSSKLPRFTINSFRSVSLPSFCIKTKKYQLEHVALAELFTSLELIDMVDLFCAVLVEGNVFVTSSHLNKISSAVFLLQRLMLPFQWQQIKIPLICPNMLHLCSAPLPALIGIHDSLLAEALHQVLDVNLANAPDPNNTGLYLLLNLDDPDRGARLRRLDAMKNKSSRVHQMFPPPFIYNLKTTWKTLLKKLSQCEITIDEFAKCAFHNAQCFLAYLILGYKDCYIEAVHSQNSDSSADKFVFDHDKFINFCSNTTNSNSSSGSSASNANSTAAKTIANFRRLITQCQYFEQFVYDNRPGCPGQEKESVRFEELRKFDLVYSWIVKSELQKRNSPYASKLSQNFYIRVDTAYSKLADQTQSFQAAMKSKSSIMKAVVKNKIPETARSSVFYISPPVLLSHEGLSNFKLPVKNATDATKTNSRPSSPATTPEMRKRGHAFSLISGTAQTTPSQITGEDQPDYENLTGASNFGSAHYSAENEDVLFDLESDSPLGKSTRSHTVSTCNQSSLAHGLSQDRVQAANLIDFSEDSNSTNQNGDEPDWIRQQKETWSMFENLGSSADEDSKSAQEELEQLFSAWEACSFKRNVINQTNQPQFNSPGVNYFSTAEDSWIGGNSSNDIRFSNSNPFL